MDLIFCKFVIVAQSINNQSTSNSIIQIFVSETTEKREDFISVIMPIIQSFENFWSLVFNFCICYC